MSELTTSITAYDMDVLSSGRFFTSTENDTVVHLDPKDEEGEKFKVIFRFVGSSTELASISPRPLEDDSPHGMIIDLINFKTRRHVGVDVPMRIATNPNGGGLYISFMVHAYGNGAPADNARLFDYTFYRTKPLKSKGKGSAK